VRYAPGRAFPPYAFLPGRDPHPTRDPAGHSFGRASESTRPLDPQCWRENVPYLFGVDLYNHAFLWEAHEAWEDVWHATKADRIQALFLQGLIQCAAAWLKIPMQQPRGLERLSHMALEKLEQVRRAEGPRYMGLALLPFSEAVRIFAETSPTTVEGYPRLLLEE
jgi:hypothetical protein